MLILCILTTGATRLFECIANQLRQWTDWRSLGNFWQCISLKITAKMGRRGWLDYVNSAPMVPAFKPLPKVRDCTLLLPRKGAHRILSDAWQKLR